MEIIDISDPTAPVKVGQFYDCGSAQDVFVSGLYAYVADGFDGLEILHISGGEDHNITIVAPISSSSWGIGSSYNIYWESTGYLSTVNIELYRDGIFESVIDSNVSNHNSYYWTLPSSLDHCANYQIKIIDAFNSSVYDYSDNFGISTKLITVTAPDISSLWDINSSYYIYWDSIGYITEVNIELYRDDVFEITIATNYSNNGSYNWTLPWGLNESSNYQIKITDAFDLSIYDFSDYFEISKKKISIPGYNLSLLIGLMLGISAIVMAKNRGKYKKH